LLGLNQLGPAAGNALLAVKGYPGDIAARTLAAEALAAAFRNKPPAGLRDSLINAIRNGGVDPGPLLSLVAEQLRKLGAVAQADAVIGS
jgi:hypothetical protein